MNINALIQGITIAIIPLIFAITLHEAAHGWVASKLGDKTALMLGRVTLNPLKHIDPLGTVVLPIIMMFIGGIIFGWAKPVPVNWRNLHNPRRDSALVALAGPLSNFLMALFWAAIAKINITLFQGHENSQLMNNITSFIQLASLFGITINCILMVLNLLPIPPLDGSRVLSSILPYQAAAAYEKIEPFGIWILLILLVIGVLGFLILPPTFFLVSSIKNIFGLL